LKNDFSQQINVEKQKKAVEHCVLLGGLKWLHAIDFDPSSRSFGVADREYWGWKTKDFANATWQGGIAGFLDTHEQLNLSKESVIKIVRATVHGMKTLQRRNGSFEEAYPWESSACVTGLIVFNLLYAFYVYPHYFDSSLYKVIKDIIKRSFQFLDKTRETHGLIANHLATIIFAKRMARRFLGIVENNEELDHFLMFQHSKEGWFPEYGGPDPGYQTLLNHYVLAGAYALKELHLIIPTLKKSLDFISLFCFPDGSYGGEIGTRGTSIVYPSGFLLMEEQGSLKEFRESEWFLCQHQGSLDAVTPLTVDGPNFTPVFNSWAFFSKISLKGSHSSHNLLHKEPLREEIFLADAGIFLKKSKNAFIALSLRNACVRKGLQKDAGTWTDESLVGLTCKGWTTQGASVENFEHKENKLSWSYQAIKRKQVLNTPGKHVILRLVSMILFPFPMLQRVLKKSLVSYVMRPCKTRSSSLVANIDLNDPMLTLKIQNNGYEVWEAHAFGFHQHMASANTFAQRQIS